MGHPPTPSENQSEAERASRQVQDLTEEASVPLHPDLEACRRDGGILPFVSHKLIHQPYVFMLNKTLNASYEHKRGRYAEYLAAKKWHSLLFLVERPYRLQEFFEQQHLMSNEDYWENLGWVYRDSESVNQYFVPSLLRSTRPCRERLMDEDSAAEFAAMPDEITVFKGYHKGYEWDSDFSFSTSKATAEWFARRFNRPAPKVLTARVKKTDVIAFMCQRGESEILADPALVEILEIQKLRAKSNS